MGEEKSLCVTCEHLFVATAENQMGGEYSFSACLKESILFERLWEMAMDCFIDKVDGAFVPFITSCSHYNDGGI